MLAGSDFGLFHLGFGIGMVAYTNLKEEAKRNIIGGNALSVLERTSWWRSFGE
jgi:hypothetical protein